MVEKKPKTAQVNNLVLGRWGWRREPGKKRIMHVPATFLANTKTVGTWESNLPALCRNVMQISCSPRISQELFSKHSNTPQPTSPALTRQCWISAGKREQVMVRDLVICPRQQIVTCRSALITALEANNNLPKRSLLCISQDWRRWGPVCVLRLRVCERKGTAAEWNREAPCREALCDRYYCVILHRISSALPSTKMGWCIADRWQITWGTI